MGQLYVKPGQILWYCNRKTGELGTVQVKYAYPGEFIIEYKDKLYRLPFSALGKRLFFTRNGAACPTEIGKRRERREKKALNEAPIIDRQALYLYDLYEGGFSSEENHYGMGFEGSDEDFSFESWLQKFG